MSVVWKLINHGPDSLAYAAVGIVPEYRLPGVTVFYPAKVPVPEEDVPYEVGKEAPAGGRWAPVALLAVVRRGVFVLVLPDILLSPSPSTSVSIPSHMSCLIQPITVFM